MKFDRWQISHQILKETEKAFHGGTHEVFAIWTAAIVTDSADFNTMAKISRCIIPAQTPGVTPQGVYVHIEGRELQRIQLDNHAKQERSIVQLHTHPGCDVNMSTLDRQWEVVRHIGALSIIVPYYGQKNLASFPGVNVYERESADWRLWQRDEIANRLVII